MKKILVALAVLGLAVCGLYAEDRVVLSEELAPIRESVTSVERRATDLEASTNALVAALAAATNRIAELEWETGEYWCKWNVNDLSITQTNWVPTNWPARRICVEVRSLGESNTAVIAIRKGWYPPKRCEIDFVFPGWVNTSGTVKFQVGGTLFSSGGTVNSPSTTSFTWIKLCWEPNFGGMWTLTKSGFNNYWNRMDPNGDVVNYKVGNDLFKPVWDLPEP